MITFMNKYDLYTVEFPIFLDLPAVVTLDVDFHDKYNLQIPFFDLSRNQGAVRRQSYNMNWSYVL